MEFGSGEIITIALFLVGGIFTILAHYVKFMNEFSYIKGQLSQLLELHGSVLELVDDHAKLERDIIKNFKDLDKAFLRIKILENKKAGGHHEFSS